MSLLRQWAECGYWWYCICVKKHQPWCKNLKVREFIPLPTRWLMPCVLPWAPSCRRSSTGRLQLLCRPSCPMQVSQRPQGIFSSLKHLPVSHWLELSRAKNNIISSSGNEYAAPENKQPKRGQINYFLKVHVLLLWSHSQTLDLQLSCILYLYKPQLCCSSCRFLLELSFRIKSQSKAIYKPPFILFFHTHYHSILVLISHITFSTTAKMTATAVPWLLLSTPRLAPRWVSRSWRGSRRWCAGKHTLYSSAEMLGSSSCSVDHIKAVLPGDTSQHGRRAPLGAFCPLESSGCNIFLLSLTQTWRMSSLTRSHLLEARIFPSAQADSKVPGTEQGDTLKRNCFRGECLGTARKTVVGRYYALRQAHIQQIKGSCTYRAKQ